MENDPLSTGFNLTELCANDHEMLLLIVRLLRNMSTLEDRAFDCGN